MGSTQISCIVISDRPPLESRVRSVLLFPNRAVAGRFAHKMFLSLSVILLPLLAAIQISCDKTDKHDTTIFGEPPPEGSVGNPDEDGFVRQPPERKTYGESICFHIGVPNSYLTLPSRLQSWCEYARVCMTPREGVNSRSCTTKCSPV